MEQLTAHYKKIEKAANSHVNKFLVAQRNVLEKLGDS